MSLTTAHKSHLLPVYNRLPVALVRGSGSRVWDAHGVEYLDFVAGIATNSLGHCDAGLQQVLQRQAATLWQVSNWFEIPASEAAADALSAATGFDLVFFCNSGAEANELLIKLARRHGQKNLAGTEAIYTLGGSFHGRTTGAASLTGQERIHAGFGSLLPEVYYLEPNCLEPLIALAERHPPAAVLVEPILAEGGGVLLERDYLVGLREFCDKSGALLMFDEVQTGIGRTGMFLAAQQNPDITVDAISLAKGIAGGFPCGAVLLQGAHGQVLEPGTHASTFGGNPLAASLVEAVANRVSAADFLHDVRQKGALILEYAERWLAEGNISRLFGRGLWWIVDPLRDALQCEREARAKGLLVLPTQGRSLRFLPPLNISRDDLLEGLNILDEVLQHET